MLMSRSTWTGPDRRHEGFDTGLFPGVQTVVRCRIPYAWVLVRRMNCQL